jgi:DNA replication protein DnaC
MALAELKFIDRADVLHLVGPPGTRKSHLSVALGVEAIKAGRSVYFTTLADLVGVLAKAEREGALREKIRFLCRFALLIVDEIGYLPVTPGGGNLFFQLVNARYEKGAMILTSNRGFAEWGEVFGDPVVATALLDRLLHHARDQVTVSAIMRISSLSTSDQRLSFSLQRSPRNPSAAASRPRTEAPITPTADHRPAKWGILEAQKWGDSAAH